MNLEETKKIMGVIAVTYPTWKVPDPELAIRVWQNMLAEYDYKMVGEALKRFIKTDTSGFAPTPGQIIDKLSSMSTEETSLSASEAWVLVYKAICNGTYNSQEEYAKLPKVVQRAVGSHEQIKAWAMDPEFNAGVESSNFKRAYEVVLKREVEAQKIAPDLKILEAVRQRLMIEGANGNS